MKLEKYMKINGALVTPAYKEVPDVDISKNKGTRAITVNNIVVTATLEDGTIEKFQGDEESQNRLARSGWAMDKMNVLTIPWKTADNKVVNLNVTDIANILLLSGMEQTRVWF